jgi:hypothetical protein
MTTTTPAMPSRGHASTPKFSADQPRELNRFFQELENLFAGSNLTDIDKLVGETMRVGIRSLADLSKYYSTYFTITSYLIAKEHMGKIEQSKMFIQALQPDLWARTLQKLQEGKKDQH